MKKGDKKCKNCLKPFTPRRPLQGVCGLSCAIAWKDTKEAKKSAQKAQRAAYREKRLELKTKSQWLKEAEREICKWVRKVRDIDLPCVTCGKYDAEIPNVWRGGKWDGGHYKTKGGHPELRLEPTNIHKQCKSCNSPGPNKADWVREQYDINIQTRITPEEYQWLIGPHKPLHQTIPDIIEIKQKYQKLNRATSKSHINKLC